MKKLLICLLISSCFLWGISFVWGIWWFTVTEPIWTQNQNQVLDVDWIGDDPLREGTYRTIKNPDGIDSIGGVISEKIDSHTGAMTRTMELLQTIINYALWLLAFIALVYLIYHGFLMLSAAGDDKQFDKWKSWIKTAAIALIGIGMSRLIVSLILWLIKQIAS